MNIIYKVILMGILACGLVWQSKSFAAEKSTQTLYLPIGIIYDGDTIKTRLPLPAPLDKMSIRILGIDTPEMPAKSYRVTGKLGRAKCVQEAEFAIEVRDFVRGLAAGAKVMHVTDFKHGRNGGRIVGSVKILGHDIATTLIGKQFAVEYWGSGPKKDWCL